jgi:hypothetical protein
MADPEANSVRALAARHHLSIKRIDAILRLKGLEESWKKDGKPIQTGFMQGMESILGVPQTKVFTTLDESKPVPVQYDTNQQVAKTHSDRYDAVEADREDEEAGGFDWARQRYQRIFGRLCPRARTQSCQAFWMPPQNQPLLLLRTRQRRTLSNVLDAQQSNSLMLAICS